MLKLKPIKTFILLFALWQLISLYLIIVGVWPITVVWLNVAVAMVFITIAPVYDSLLLLIVSIPFFTVIPNSRLETLATWRILFAWLFLVWLLKTYSKHPKNILSAIKFMPWDKYLALFMAVAVLLLPFSQFPVQSIKQILFFVNIYFIYLILINTLTTREQVIGVIKYTACSLVTIVALGYAQLFLTFFTSFDYFGKAWALMASSVYYGQSLANVLLYSNSWFSYTGGTSLRMFSILPDSHAFALICIFAVSFLLMLTYLIGPKKLRIRKKSDDLLSTEIPLVHDPKSGKVLGMGTNYWLWYAVRFAGLAIILSGTRATWVGLFAPVLIIIWFIRTKTLELMARKAFWPFVIIIVFFLLSPFINKGLGIIRAGGFQENFIDRAKSIYDVGEESNLGRLQMWEKSLGYAAHHPFGAGLGNFISSLDSGDTQNFNDLANQHNKNFNLPQKYVTAHSLYLQIFVELGILGLAAFVWFWWNYFVAVWKFIKKHGKENNILLFFVLNTSLAFVWILASGVFDVTLFNDKVLMYFFISLAITGAIVKKYPELNE